MTALQTAIADVGIALQSAKGSAASAPTWQFGLKGGQVAQLEVTQDVEDLTSGKRVAGHANRTLVVPGADWTSRGWYDPLGLLLYAALGGYAVTGADPYTHTFTVGASLPYLTVWGSLAANHHRLDDAKLDQLSLSWQRNDPVEIAATLLGLNLTPGVSDPTPAEDDVTCSRYIRPVGGTFKVDVDGDTPATAKVTAGTLTIANNATADAISGAITPDDVDEARVDLTASLTLKATDLAPWREVKYGSAAGTTIAADVVYGSLELTFTDGTNELVLTGERVPFDCSLPEANPTGGTGEIVLEGMLLGCGATDEAITAELTNSVADYTP